MTSDKIIEIVEFAMQYFTGFGLDKDEEQEFLDQYYNKYGVGPEEEEYEEEYDEWFEEKYDDTPTFFDEEYNEVG